MQKGLYWSYILQVSNQFPIPYSVKNKPPFEAVCVNEALMILLQQNKPQLDAS